MNNVKRSLIYVFLIILILMNIAPFWIMFVNSTRSSEQILQGLSVFPSRFLGNNWSVLTGRGFSLWIAFKNSVIISFSATLLSLYFSSLTAYAFVVYEFRAKKAIFAGILIMMMVPAQVSLVGFYQFMLRLNLVDTFIPLILPAIATPINVFFFKQYFDASFQMDLVQAARIDGASEIGIFHKIILPIARPALATVGIFSIVTSWNNYITPLAILTSEDKYTLPMVVQLLKADIYSTEYGGIYLGLSLSILPLLLTYLLLSKHIIAGISLGGVKG